MYYQCKLLRKVHSSPLSEPNRPGPHLVCALGARVKCEWEPSHGHVGWAGTPPPGAEQWRNPWAMVAHLILGIMVSSPKHDAQGKGKKKSEDLQIQLSCPAGAGRSRVSWESEGAVGQFPQQQLHNSWAATTQNASPSFWHHPPASQHVLKTRCSPTTGRSHHSNKVTAPSEHQGTGIQSEGAQN